ncbi:MAG: hypothetical protein EF806_03660 [Candidatus Methanoliparum thermophilum]|uniref:Uncharacterized protein n=1 Tax=Methanoliparum thermophilum TaxID=2491083 RepID=A0A520KRM9_METT2|nr:hypothetical protein [Candidatus Methanoliparum sp. LAM-1]RZN64451.1 MAG: hypothetical protein EF806_03660 [Candidatus Methanoliparum thermophilum]
MHESRQWGASGTQCLSTLLRIYDDGSKYGAELDRWPYSTDSAEAVFANEFFNPTNGPQTSDGRRPTYKENVYSFQYGPVKIIAFNNYWFSSNPEKYGGLPEGYIMDDQLEWIRDELDSAESDLITRYVILFAQEPVLPNGGYIGDAMWYDGDNNARGYTVSDNKVLPEKRG